MRDTTLFREFLTGLFALAALVGLAATLMLFGETANILERNYRFTVVLGNSAGLGETSPVRLNGVKVGQIKSAKVRTPPAVGVELLVEIKSSIRIPRCAIVSIDKGFVGDASLDFVLQPGEDPAALAAVIQPDEVFDGGSPLTMIERITSTLEKPLQRLTATADEIEKMAATYTRVGERLNEMLEPRTPEDVEQGKDPNVRSTLARLDKALASADHWLGDEQLRSRASDLVVRADAALADVSELAKRWTATAEKAEGTLAQVESVADETRGSVREVAAQAVAMLSSAQDAAGSLTTALEQATNGPGTVGQLMQNPDLYNSVRSAADRLDKVLVELQLLVEKYRTEGIPLKL